jgi:PAS domain S-box-containing protein
MSRHTRSALPVGSRQVDNLILTGHERFLDKKDIIVSKTDVRGVITYVNNVFLNIAGYTEMEMLGAPHSVIRHPHMPRCAFKLLWDELAEGREIFAYVINRSKVGDHYWVLAHVTPSYSLSGELIGYHSSRRAPTAKALETIKPLYAKLLDAEKIGRKEGLEASTNLLHRVLADNNISYDEFVFSL